MRAGRLRHRITIQRMVKERDALGGVAESWCDMVIVSAEIRMINAQERFVGGADQQVATVTHRVKIRYRSDVTPLNRIVHGDRLLDIESAVDPDGRRRELIMMCREVVQSD